MRYRSLAWMRLYRATLAEAAKPLPIEGGLCDQTPEPERHYAEAGRWEPRQAPTYTPGSLAESLHRQMAQLLLERDAETQRADRAEAQLRAAETRIHGLKETVRAYAGHTCDTAVMPRVRSHPAPGAMRIADDELLIVPLPGEAGR